MRRAAPFQPLCPESADASPGPAGSGAARRAAWARAAVLALTGALAGCRSAPPVAPVLPGAVKVPASTFRPGAPSAPAADPDGPATHIGRTVLPQCHKMVVAAVVATTRAGLGAEIVRIRETDVLWGPAEDSEEPYTVLCGAIGLAPRPGGSALFLLRLLPAGEYQALEVAPIDDADGATRLRTFRTYLQIEAVEDPEARRSLLLAYLRSAVASADTWTRSNAVREYSAFADAFPGMLRPEDAAALAKAVTAFRDPELKRLAQRALDAAPATAGAGPRRPATPLAGTTQPAGLAAFEKRYADPGADAPSRRGTVLEAAAALDRGAAPLVARGLEDADPSVREASAAAAGECAITDLAPRLLTAAATDVAPAVRRTAVVALGHLRAASAVPTLGGLARSDDGLGRESLFALARIRDDAAMTTLRSLRDDAVGERRKLADFLLTEDFVRQERAMGARWASGK